MASLSLPPSVRKVLASIEVRTHHHLWHKVRDETWWVNLEDYKRDKLEKANWKAPRFRKEKGAGLDFLYMHRRMIGMVNDLLKKSGDKTYAQVTGWDPIPWDSKDKDWPVPTWIPRNEDFHWLKGFPASHLRWTVEGEKDPKKTNFYKDTVATQFRNDTWLKNLKIDELGTKIEWSIHGWMHNRWCDKPPADIWSTDESNDFLLDPFSSHVNDVFWKLHGWIDDRIKDWEAATSNAADFSGAWDGPAFPGGGPLIKFESDAKDGAHQHMMHHRADPALLAVLDDPADWTSALIPDEEVVRSLMEEMLTQS